RSDVPEAKLSVVAQSHERTPSGVEVERVYASVVARKRLPDGSRSPCALEAVRWVEFPEHNSAGTFADGDEFSVRRRKPNGEMSRHLTCEAGQDALVGDVPDERLPAQGCCREQLSVRAEVEIGNASVTDKLARLPARPEVYRATMLSERAITNVRLSGLNDT